ncbi:MAG: sensor histidine kinase [Cohnella sp.]|uniref:cache domain-containing sensor histidine kinase n=1 Tax=Cohnella sp. TaxID=1883426 RepID=UPI000E39AD2B|nr:histidine kinase [Cohnella sp.]REK61186.1 MAG: sensor histidine kinase [Cohnella sp.]
MRKRLSNPLTKIKLKQQLILLFCVLVGPVFLLNWYANAKAAQLLKRHVTNAYAELNKLNFTLINRDLDTVNRIMATIIQYPITQEMRPRAGETFDRVQKYAAADKLLASYSLGMTEGEAVYYYLFIYDPDNAYSFAPNTATRFKTGGVYFYNDRNKPAWIDEAIAKKGKGYLRLLHGLGTSTDATTLGYVRAVNSITEGNVVIGALVATNMDKKIEQSLATISLPDEGEIYLTDYDNTVLAASVPAIGTKLELPPGLNAAGSPDGTADAIASGYIYVMHYNDLLQQKLIYKIPTRSMLQQQNELKRAIQLISIVYSLFAIVVMAYFWRSLIAPLQRLAVFTRSYAPGRRLPKEPAKDRNDEVGVLIHSVYGMAGRLNALIEDRYMLEIKQKEAQLQILYQQINPHLLYNTLESIYWKSSLEGNSESAEMIKELAKLMRISLSRGRELITLREELEHAKAYTRLEQKKYEYEFTVEWRIDEEVLSVLIPKITLQPLIENAIIHGVRSMGEDGEIVVTAVRDGETLVLTVADNGYKTVDYEAIERLLRDKENAAPSGYGIRNVQQRIELHFGAAYGLSYSAREGGGTQAAIVLPLRYEAESAGA